MPYVAKRTIFKLDFEEPEMAGLEVRVRSVSLGDLMDVADEADAAEAGAGLSRVRNLLGMFIDALVDWDLAQEAREPGAPPVDTPPTLAGLLSHEPRFALGIVLTWYRAMVSVSAPLVLSSTSGARYPEVSLPMDIPSPSLVS